MGIFGVSSKKTAVSTDESRVNEVLSRAVANVIPRELGHKKLSSGERLRVYFGIDPTGAKLHLGHSVPLRKLRAFAKLGHEVVFLVGSFTAMIGDPSGRDAARAPLSPEQVRENFQDYKRQAQKILDFSHAEIRYNDEWLAPMTFSKIVELASSFTVQQMLQRDMFERRLKEGKPIALHEFLYPLMVGYDSVMLNVDCELGGSDQEFNMLAGRHLQQVFGKRDKFVLTTRLIEGTDGRKMSKSYNNCVYLEDAPEEMYGKLMSIKDELVPSYFEDLTDVAPDEIERVSALHPKEAKMRLARELVTMYHTETEAQEAQESWQNTFSEGGIPSDVPSAPPIKRGTILVEAIQSLGISNSELRRLLDAKAIREVSGDEQVFTDLKNPIERDMVIRIGKHRFLKIIVE